MSDDRDSPFDSANQALAEIHECVGASKTAIEAGRAVTKLDTGTRLYDHPEARPLQTDGRADFPICDGAIGA